MLMSVFVLAQRMSGLITMDIRHVRLLIIKEDQ